VGDRIPGLISRPKIIRGMGIDFPIVGHNEKNLRERLTMMAGEIVEKMGKSLLGC
jgi:hypothetical protein